MKITIITPIKDRANFHHALARVVERQTHRVHEHLIVEETISWRAHAQPLASATYHLCGRGLAVGEKLNLAVEHATGDLIVVMHSDDYYAPEYIQALVDFYSANPIFDVVTLAEQWQYNLVERRYELLKAGGNGVGSSALAFRRKVFKQVQFGNRKKREGQGFVNKCSEGVQMDPIHCCATVQMRETMTHLWHGNNSFTEHCGRTPDPDLQFLNLRVKDKWFQDFYAGFYQPEE